VPTCRPGVYLTTCKQVHLLILFKLFCFRYQAGDFSGALLQEVSALKNFPSSRPAFAPIFPNHYGVNHWSSKVPLKVSTLLRFLFRFFRQKFPILKEAFLSFLQPNR